MTTQTTPAQPTGDAAANNGTPAGASAPQAVSLDGLTADQITGLYAKSPDLFKGVVKAPEAPKPPVVKLPDGAQIDASVLKEFVDLATAKGLSSEQAQAQVDFFLRLSAKGAEAAKAADAAWRKANVESLKSDPEFGKSFDANSEIAKRPLAKYADETFTRELAAMGLDNHPGMVKFLHKIGKAMGEDTTPRPAASSVSAESEGERLAKRYPTMFPPAK